MRWQGILGVATAAAGALAFSGCGDEPFPTRTIPSSVLDQAAPPIGGGTLVRIGADRFAAADPDTDQIHFVSIGGQSVESVDLEPGDEPGRLALADGKVFAALRSGGALVSVDLASLATRRLAICPAPRGVLVDGDVVHVACAGGELVTADLNLDGVQRTLQLERDLRDVVKLADGRLAVSVFRSAGLIVLDPEGAMVERHVATSTIGFDSEEAFTPAVAWRSIPMEGGVLMVHQRGTRAPVPIDPDPSAPPQSSPYGGGGVGDPTCGDNGILHAGATVFGALDGAQHPTEGFVLGAIVLPVDIALSPTQARYAVVGAGSNRVVYGDRSDFDMTSVPPGVPRFDCLQSTGVLVSGEPVAVTFDGPDELVVQRRQPAGLVRISLATHAVVEEIAFGGPSRRQVGHMLFHEAASPTSPIACASCHPEGREDGRVWEFEQLGARRTQSLAGGVLDTAPLHWDGDLGSLDDLMGEVFVERMGGVVPSDAQLGELAAWMQTIPHLPPSRHLDAAAVERGESLFHDATVGCATCHGGEKLTNHTTVAVGTGKSFQVPSLLGIADRAPFMHDGCAATLRDRFDPICGGGDQHGVTSHLTEAQLDDLVAYLESL